MPLYIFDVVMEITLRFGRFRWGSGCSRLRLRFSVSCGRGWRVFGSVGYVVVAPVRDKMAFFIRARQQDIPTPTISTVASDDEDNFITDPEKFFDELPQPFRLINKVLGSLIETAWEKISEREHLREIEAKRIKPPTYTASDKLEQYENVTCFHVTETDVAFLASKNSLIAVKRDTHEDISSWQPEDELCIERISSVFISSADLHLVGVVDDMGFSHLLLYENDKFHLISIVNELVEGSPKSNTLAIGFSKDAQFFGISLETNRLSSLEFYRIPLENWIKEVDAARKEYEKKVESAAPVEEDESTQSDVEFPPIKFSPLNPCLKVNQLSAPISISNKSPQQLLDSVASGDVIGDGTCHLFSENALNIQDKLFHVTNERDLIYAEDEDNDILHRPKFFFLKKSIMEPPVSGKNSESGYLYVGIWWSHHQNFYVYQLNKTGKNIEFKPDAVWPQSSDITCCAVACDTTLLAIGLNNGSITLWDRNLGLVKNVLMISPGVAINSINFAIHEDSSQTQYSFRNKDVTLLVGSSNGQICDVISGNNPSSRVVVVGNDQIFDIIKPIYNHPNVFLVINKDGSIMLRSTQNDKVLCVLNLPENFQYEDPYCNGCVLDDEAGILYMRASSISSMESIILMFHLCHFPTLDKYRTDAKKGETYEYIKFDDIVQQHLTARMRQQAYRTKKLATRWHDLDKQLEVIQNLRQSMSNAKREMEFARKPASAARWGRSTAQIISHNKDLQRVPT